MLSNTAIVTLCVLLCLGQQAHAQTLYRWIDDQGRVRMVDVSDKPDTDRRAVAEAVIVVGPDIMATIAAGEVPKGNVYEVARIAAIQAAKRTAETIPLCHQVPLAHVDVAFTPSDDRITIRTEARTRSGTGVEMEALVAAATAGLTLYDMLKALGHGMTITGVRLLEKSGGRSGTYVADTPGTGSNPDDPAGAS